MVMSLFELKKAVFKKMKVNFPEYKLFNESITQGIEYPAFHIDIVPWGTPVINDNMHSVHIFVNMTHFSERGKRDDDLIAFDKWRQLFYEPIQLESGIAVTPVEHRLHVIDGLYHMIFNIEETFVVPKAETGEYIQEIIYNNTIE